MHDSSVNGRNLIIAVIALVFSTLLAFWEIYNGTQEVKYGRMQVEQEQNVRLNDSQQQAIENKLDESKIILEQARDILQELKKLEAVKTKTLNLTETKKTEKVEN